MIGLVNGVFQQAFQSRNSRVEGEVEGIDDLKVTSTSLYCLTSFEDARRAFCFRSIQCGIYAFGKAHKCSTPVSQNVTSTVFQTVPLFSFFMRGLVIIMQKIENCFCVCLVFFPLSLCLARWFWPDLMNGRHVPTTAVCVSLRWSGGLRVVRLPAGSRHGPPLWQSQLRDTSRPNKRD